MPAEIPVFENVAIGPETDSQEPTRGDLSLFATFNFLIEEATRVERILPLESVQEVEICEDQKHRDSKDAYMEVDHAAGIGCCPRSKALSISTNEMVPCPLPFLVNVTVGSRVISAASGAFSLSILQIGDSIKIGNVHNTLDWVISCDTPQNFTPGSLMLTSEYKDFNLDTVCI